MAPLEIKVNGHKKQLEAAITDLNGIDMFLGHVSQISISGVQYKDMMIIDDGKYQLMLLSLRSNPQTQKYIYKRVIVHAQAIAII